MNGVIFRLLAQGPGLSLVVGGRGLTAGPPIEQCLLAVLLMSPNQAVSVEEISDRLWERHRSPDNAVGTIGTYVTKIRGRLRKLVGERVKIVGKQGTYTIQVDPEMVDVHRFQRLHNDAIAAMRRGALERAVELYRAAESLCGGDPLSGLPGAWARRVGRSLSERLVQVRRARIGVEVRLGRYAEALSELPELVARNPRDEELTAHLMTALYETGRRADALVVYRRTRAYLTENLGMEPDRRLSALYRRILGADDEPRGRRGDRPGPARLPADVPRFVGREREMELLAGVRADRRGGGVVVIEGMPGVGKTALAVHAAHRLAEYFPDARLYLDLKAHDATRPPLDARTALGELLGMLGVPPSGVPATVDERSAMWRALVADLSALLVLDDADGLEPVLPLLPADIDGWGGLVLVTSRVRADLVPGLRRVPLGVLSAEEAAELWSGRTGGRPEPSGGTLPACAGLPLAIVRAAGDATDGTGGPARRPPEVRDAVRLSYRRLPPDRQRAFRRLALYPGREMTMDVVSVLLDEPPDAAARLVDSLRRRHLVEEGGTGRFRLHRQIRDAGYDLAQSVDHEHEIRGTVRRLLRHRLSAADAADRAMFPHRRRAPSVPESDRRDPPALPAARAWFHAEWRDTLELARYAAEHEWKAQCAQLMHVMAEYLDFRQLFTEAAEGHALAVQACRDAGDDLGIARASLDLCLARIHTGGYDDSIQHVKEALKIYDAWGRRWERARCLEWLGLACWGKDERRHALALWEQAVDDYRDLGDRKGIADVLRHKAMANWNIGHYAESNRLYDEALRRYEEIGDRLGRMKTLNNKGYVAQTMARHRDADRLYRRAGAICKEMTGQENHAILDHNLGDLHKYKRRYELALDRYARALAAYQEAGHRRNQADVLNAIAEAYLGMERPPVALDHFQRARDLAEEIGCRSEQARAIAGIAAVHRQLDNHDLALEMYEYALGLALAIDDPRQRAMILDGQARTLFRRGRGDAARVAWRGAVALYEDIGLHESAQEVKLQLQALGGVSMDID